MTRSIAARTRARRSQRRRQAADGIFPVEDVADFYWEEDLPEKRDARKEAISS